MQLKTVPRQVRVTGGPLEGNLQRRYRVATPFRRKPQVKELQHLSAPCRARVMKLQKGMWGHAHEISPMHAEIHDSVCKVGQLSGNS